MFGWLKKAIAWRAKGIPLEEQLQKLQEIGITLNPGVTVDSLLLHTTREEFEAEPYDRLLLKMGCEVEMNGEFVCVSDSAWYEDTELVEDHGVYVEIFKRLRQMTGLEIEDIEDYVDIMKSLGSPSRIKVNGSNGRSRSRPIGWA